MVVEPVKITHTAGLSNVTNVYVRTNCQSANCAHNFKIAQIDNLRRACICYGYASMAGTTTGFLKVTASLVEKSNIAETRKSTQLYTVPVSFIFPNQAK